MAESVRGRLSNGNAPAEAFRVLRSSKSGYYSGIVTTVPNGSSDIALTSLAGASGFFGQLPEGAAHFLEIYSDYDVSIKFRTIQNSSTAVGSLTSIRILGNTFRTITFIADVTEVYFSNTSSYDASVEVVAI